MFVFSFHTHSLICWLLKCCNFLKLSCIFLKHLLAYHVVLVLEALILNLTDITKLIIVQPRIITKAELVRVMRLNGRHFTLIQLPVLNKTSAILMFVTMAVDRLLTSFILLLICNTGNTLSY